MNIELDAMIEARSLSYSTTRNRSKGIVFKETHQG